jgi:kinase suppressor of Ras 2
MADEGLEVIQSIREVIDISADHLDRLRTQCQTSVLTQQETRTLESKLVRMFCELLLNRQNMSSLSSSSIEDERTEIYTSNYDLKQWLRVVGLSQQTITAVIQHVNSLENMLKMNDEDICAILTSNQTTVQTEEARRLVCAINNLKRYQQCLKAGTEPSEMYWDSWDRRANNIRLTSSPKIMTNRKFIKIICKSFLLMKKNFHL